MRYFGFIFIFIFIVSCRPQTYTPKPAGYFRIDTFQHAYQVFNEPEFPYSFEYPVYATITRDTSFFGEKPENPYWININIPSMKGTIYISYKIISAKQPFSKLLEDAHKMTWFHDTRADYIETSPFINRAGVTSLLFDVGGNAASAYQFIATDSVKNFIRGALYFDVPPNVDSLRPANNFMKTDILHLLATLKFK